MSYTEKYADYSWIKVKKYKVDNKKSWKQRYEELDAHHVRETNFLIDKVRELAGELDKVLYFNKYIST